MGYTRIAVVVFVLIVALGPLYTAPGYSATSNVISELAAQNTPRNWLMSSAFLVLGGAVARDGFRWFRRPLLPFIAFGILFAAVGLFGHRPLTPGEPFTPWVDSVHSVLASLSGVALTVGFIWQSIRANASAYRILAAALAVTCIALPLLMLAVPQYQGAIQRLMYVAVFAWLWAYYPRRIHASEEALAR
jgi:hypothetical membrane protein